MISSKWYRRCNTLQNLDPVCFRVSIVIAWGHYGDAHSLLFAEARDCYIRRDPFSYTGTLAVTREGTSCLSWADPGVVTYIAGLTPNPVFPEADVANAANYCRNPTRSVSPWCVVETERGQYCNVSMCQSTERVETAGGCSNQIILVW